MKKMRTSLTIGPVLIALTSPVIALVIAIVAGWPWWLWILAPSTALALVALGLSRRNIADRLSPLQGNHIEGFLGQPHQARTRRVSIAIALVTAGASLLWFILGGGQWALALFCFALGAAVFYWGVKICPANHPKRSSAAVATGAWILSLSANFTAGAMTGATSLERSAESMSSSLVAITDMLKELIRGQKTNKEQMDRIEAYIAGLKQAGLDPEKLAIPPDVLEAAKSLSKSKSARERAAAAIVLKRYAEADKEFAALHGDIAETEVFKNQALEGDRYFAEHRFDEAIPHYRIAQGLQPKAPDVLNGLAICLLASTSVNNVIQAHDEAILLLETALAAHRESKEGDSRRFALTLMNLGAAYQERNRSLEAEPLYAEASDMLNRLKVGIDPTLATCLCDHAYVLAALGRLKEADAPCRQALQMRQQLFPGDNLIVAASLNNLGELLARKVELKESLTNLQEALRMRLLVQNGVDDLDVARSLSNVAYVQLATGDTANADANYLAAIAMFDRLFSNGHPDAAVTLAAYGNMLKSLNRLEEAENICQRVVKMRQSLFGDDHIAVVDGMVTVASIRELRNDNAGAESLYREALSIRDRIGAEETIDTALHLHDLAMVIRKRFKGNEELSQDAVSFIDRAAEIVGSLYPDPGAIPPDSDPQRILNDQPLFHRRKSPE